MSDNKMELSPKQLNQLRQGIKVEGVFRNIVERCEIMINNDEIVFYSARQLTYEETLRLGRLMISRPIFREEAIPDFQFKGRQEDEKLSPLSLLIDAFFRIRQDLDFRNKFKKQDPTRFLTEFIAYNYYDCLSGGCQTFVLALLHELCKCPGIDQNAQIYPGKSEKDDDWYTVADFMVDVEKSVMPSVQKELGQIHLLLPVTLE